MPAFKDKEEFLDKFFDHMFGEGDEPSDEDHEFFEHVSKFFDQFEGENSGGSRRRRSSNNNSGGNSNSGNGGGPRRRPRQQGGNSNSGQGSYGSGLFFGNRS